MSTVLPFRRPKTPRATVDCAKRILRQAELGRITGIAFVAFMADGFTADACGDAHDRPEQTLEMLAYLEARLRRRAR